MLTAVVVDDEARNIALFSYYLEKYCPNVKLEASYTKRDNAIRALKSFKPDILFLDIVLDEGSGFDVLDEVGHEDMDVVMCTAHDEFALRAIRYQVIDYLLKPLEIQYLIQTVNKIENKRESLQGKQVFDSSVFARFDHAKPLIQQRLPLSDTGKIDFIPLEDILCVESHKGTEKCELVLKHHQPKEYMLLNYPLTYIENKLPQNIFIRISRFSVVNIIAIVAIHRNTQYTCTLSNGQRVVISRNNYKRLIALIEKVYETTI